MKVVIVSSFDINGGAARAAHRLHHALLGINVDSRMLVQLKSSNDTTVSGARTYIYRSIKKCRHLLDQIPVMRYKNKSLFSPSWLPLSNIANRINSMKPDIVHLHWVNKGFLPIQEIKPICQPIVITLHDMWSFTGGCHYSEDCTRYITGCGKCPQLNSHHERDISKWVWKRKKKHWSNKDITLIAPSRWLAQRAKESGLFKDSRIEVIPNALNIRSFKPTPSQHARSFWNLPADKKLVLFGSLDPSSDKRKGFDLLFDAITKMHNSHKDETELIIFGTSQPENPPDFGLPVHYMGNIHDDTSLALLYSAADVMVVPSRQEAFGQTASESLSCGTPVVAFRTTGLIDIVDHLKDGYLAEPFNTMDLANGIIWVITDSQRQKKMSVNARRKAETAFSMPVVAMQYESIYLSLLAS